MQPDECVRARRRDLLDVHAALRREHEERSLRAAIEGDREVVLACDLRGALDPHLLDRVASNVHAEDLRRSRLRVVRRLCELDASGLAAAAREDLRLDDDRPAELFRGSARLCRAWSRAAPPIRGFRSAGRAPSPGIRAGPRRGRVYPAARRPETISRVCEHGAMSRTTILVLVALGAALAGFAFSSAAKRLQDEEPAAEASVAARPQSASLDWRETHGTPGEQLVFSVDSLQVTRSGWRAKRRAREPVLRRVRAGRSTSDVEPLVRGHAVLDREDRGAERAERQQLHSRPCALRCASSRPCLRSSSPMRRGRGRSRRRGHSPPETGCASSSAPWSRSAILPRSSATGSSGSPIARTGSSRSRVDPTLRRRAEHPELAGPRARRRSSPGRRGRRSPRRVAACSLPSRPRNRTTEPSTAASRRSATPRAPALAGPACSAACTLSVVACPPPVVVELDPSREGTQRHGNGVLRIQATKLHASRQDEHVRREAVAALVRREPELVLGDVPGERAEHRGPAESAASVAAPVTADENQRARPVLARGVEVQYRRGPRDARARFGAPPPPSPPLGRRTRRSCARTVPVDG